MSSPASGRFSTALLVLLGLFSGRPWSQTGVTKVIPVTIRDFNSSHPDFESPACYGGKNMVQPTLDADHKPFHLPSNACPDNQLHDWFRDSPSSTRYCQDLTLTQKAGSENIFEKVDNLFFPIDNVPTKEATIPGEDGKIHNFHFCMEMHATFKYRGAEVFNFEGDDDVWVFINNKLALDLGGVHTPQSGVVDLDAQKSGLGIAAGNYYNFDFFFCERQTIGSHLKMNTSIDIIPPPAPGYYIADADLNLLVKGDTILIPQGDGTRIFKGVQIKTQNQTIDCSDVTSQVKEAVVGDWNFAGAAQPAGSHIEIDPDLFPIGVQKLYFVKDGSRDSATIRILPLSQVAKPVADPAGKEFAVQLDVSLSSATTGAAIHYTLDGTAPTDSSPVYTAPIHLTATTTLNAIATKAGMRKSAILIETYARKTATALRGYYQDKDGDGRIETAVLFFDEAFVLPPQSLWLTDPFAAAHVEKLPQIVPGPRSLTATFPPFTAGTGFAPSGWAAIPLDPGNYLAQNVVMEDSVGPVLIAAKSFPALPDPIHPALEVEFSEPVALDVFSLGFPFDLKRNSLTLEKNEIRLESVTRLSPTRYRLVFPSASKYPVPRDSLKINLEAGLADSNGNRSQMSFFIPVDGGPIQTAAEINLSLEKGLTQSTQLQAVPNAQAMVVHTATVCLNCQDPGVKKVLPSTLPADLNALGPTWKVTTRYPFRYALAFFDNLGQFVNRAEGTVTAEQLARVQATVGPGDSTRLELTFLPIAADGNAIATGAYIMKGTLTILDQPVYKGSQGEDLVIKPVATTLVSRFGFIRRGP